MLSVFLIVLPIFALIGAGWTARTTGVLGPAATRELNRFVVWLAFPALLFDIVAKAKWSEIWQPGFIAVFGIGAFTIFGLTVLWRMRGGRCLPDAAVDGLNGGYANTAFIGFPLATAVIGPAAVAPVLIATMLTVCLMFAVALLLIEIGMQTERHPVRMIAKVLRSVGTNPILIAPAMGGVFLAFAIPIPQPLDKFLTLLGGTAAPCALVALGLFIAERRPGKAPSMRDVGLLVSLKLMAQPVLTWVLAVLVFRLPAPLATTAVLIAALPTGTGPFMIAEFYNREAGITARVVLTSTVLSLLTVTAYLSIA